MTDPNNMFDLSTLPANHPGRQYDVNGKPLRFAPQASGQRAYYDGRKGGPGRSYIVNNGIKTGVSDEQMAAIVQGNGLWADGYDFVHNATPIKDDGSEAQNGGRQAIAQGGAGQAIPPPPPGFVIGGASDAQQPPSPPPGFVLDQGESGDGYQAALADASIRSQFPGATVDPRSRYNIALRKVREQFPGASDEQWRDYSSKFLAPYDPKDLAQQSQTFGFGDEINAGMGAAAAQVGQWLHGDGPGYGDAYDANYELEQARLALGREQQGGLGTAMEILGGASTMGPARTAAGALPALSVGPSLPVAAQAGSRFGQVARAAAPLAAEGSAYGFGSTDGDLGERAIGARNGAALSLAGGAVAPVAAKVIQGTGRRIAQIPVNRANKATMRQAVSAAPSASAIKGTSQAAYKAAERTGAEIGPQAMQILSHDMTNLARINGLIMPSGKLSTAYPKVAHALRSIREYAQGAVSMEQAQTLLKSIRAAQKSVDPDEARLGMQMANAFEDFFDNLPPSAFSKNGQKSSEAAQQWAKGRTEWARSKRTQAIEDIIADARIAKGGFANGLRSGFASMLKSKNAKKRRGFSGADLEAIERFVQGGPIQELLERIGSGGGVPGGVLGGLTAGPVGAVAVPAAGMGARRLTNSSARQAAQEIRAQVATPGGIPLRTLPPAPPLPMPAGLRMIGGTTANRSGS